MAELRMKVHLKAPTMKRIPAVGQAMTACGRDVDVDFVVNVAGRVSCSICLAALRQSTRRPQRPRKAS